MRISILELPLSVRAAFLFFFLFLFTMSVNAAGFAELFAAADTASPELAGARTEVARAFAEYRAACGMPNPNLFGERETLSDGHIDETEQSYGIRQPLGFLWSYAPTRSAAHQAYQSARHQHEDARRKIQLETAEYALSFLALRQQAVLLDTVMAHAAFVIKNMEARFRLGDVSQYDLHRLQTEMLRLYEERRVLLKDWHQSGQEFTRLSGLPVEWLDEFAPDLKSEIIFSSVEEAVESAAARHPLIQAQDYNVRSARQTLKAAKWNQLPDFTLGIGQKKSDPDFSGLVLEAEIELPLFSQRRAERTLAGAVLKEASIQENAVRNQIAQEARLAYRRWHDMQDDSLLFPAYDPDIMNEDLERGMLMYLHGELSPVEWIDVLRSTIESLSAYLQLTNARVIAAFELRRAAGLPLVEHP